MKPETLAFAACVEPFNQQGEEIQLIAKRLLENCRRQHPLLLKQYVRWAWKYYCHPHIDLARRISSRFFARTHYLTLRIEDNHNEIYDLIQLLEDEFTTWTAELAARRITNYIRFEETELLPLLEKNIACESLGLLEQMINTTLKEPPAWNEPFWEKQPGSQ